MQIGIYLRISSSKTEDESISINNQRKLLYNFIDNVEEFACCNVKEYIDDGYTGTNTNRPAFTELIDDVRSGQIQCIIVKDISRFSRDYLDTGEYLERVFPTHNIRFIAINDNYDSLNKLETIATDLPMALTSIINTLYSKDTSKKIIESYYTRVVSGTITRSIAPYGYTINKSTQKLEIDHDTAIVVKNIFQQRIEGKSTGMIAKKLNENGVSAPKEYYNIKNNKNSNKHYIWRASGIRDILRNDLYIGTDTAYKKKLKRIHPDNSREYRTIKIVHNHDSIVSIEEFELVQALTTKPIPSTRRKQWKYNSFLKSKVRCGHCGRRMKRSDGSKKGFHYTCRYRYDIEKPCTNTERISENILEQYCKKKIKNIEVEYIKNIYIYNPQTIKIEMD